MNKDEYEDNRFLQMRKKDARLKKTGSLYMALYGKTQLTGIERHFDENEIIVSKTDLKGKLTYANRIFYKLADMSEKECIGQPHNIIRHPEMPRAVFELLWNTVTKGEELFAYVNNRSANGDNYWVFAHVTPNKDTNGNVTGYHSSRRVPNRKILEQHIIPLYKELLNIEQSCSSPKEGLTKSYEKIQHVLRENRMNFNQFMFSLEG